MKALAILAAALAAPLAVQPDEASRTREEMERKILAAKTLKLSFVMEVQVDNNTDKLSGQVWLGEQNKARMEIKGKFAGKPLEMLMVSDGKQMVAQVSGLKDKGVHDTPRGAGALIRGTIARAGVFAGLFYGVNDSTEPRLDDLFKVSDCKLSGREKLDQREAMVLDYKVLFRGAKEAGELKVWLDSQSFLPVQRVFRLADQGHKVRVFEVYRDFTVGGEIEAKLFELPN
jgi:outer membrane lipoprotein-sorting protein